MHLELQSTAPLIVACIDLLLGIVILLQNPRSLTNISYALFAVSVAAWGFGVGSFYSLTDLEQINFFARFLYFAGGSIPVTFLYFAHVFNSKRPPSTLTTIIIFLPTAAFIYLYFFTDLIISGYLIDSTGTRGYIYGPLHYLFDLQLWSYFVWAFIVLVRKYFSSEKTDRNHLAFITFGTYSVLAIAGATNVIAPLLSIFDLVWIGPTATIIWTWVVAYAVVRHQLFNIRIVAAETLIVSLWLVMLGRTLFSANISEVWINAFFLAVTVVLGIFFIRSVIKEVRQREEIEELSKQKSEFMTFASHEIRNPITAMRGFASLVVDGTAGESSEGVKSVARKILIEGNDVLGLISQYLNKSKLEIGQLSYSHTAYDLGAAVSTLVDGYAPHIADKELTITKHIDTGHEVTVIGDEGKTKEVIGNLVDNALKYTKNGTITVSVERKDGAVRAVVSDTGVGIPQDVISQLFKKFSRADAQKVNFMGTGLGLYLAKVFIEAQGGKIWAESDGINKGSRFIVEFPAA